MKPFRVQHQKSIGLNDVHLLQNRIVLAANAAEALRVAMRNTGVELIDVRSEHLALADRSRPETCFDYWKAEFEPSHSY